MARSDSTWKNGELENTPRRLDYRVEYLDLGAEFVGVVVARGDDWRVEMRGKVEF